MDEEVLAMLRVLVGDISGDNKMKIDSEIYEKYTGLDVEKVAAKNNDSLYEASDSNVKFRAREANKYRSNSSVETHISIVLKFQYNPSIKIGNIFFYD